MSRASELYSRDVQKKAEEDPRLELKKSIGPARQTRTTLQTGDMRNARRRGTREQPIGGLPATGTAPKREFNGVTRRTVGLNLIAGLAGFQGSHRPARRFATLAAAEIHPDLLGLWRGTQVMYPGGLYVVSRALTLGFANDLSGTCDFNTYIQDNHTNPYSVQSDNWNWNSGSWTVTNQQLIFQGSGTHVHNETLYLGSLLPSQGDYNEPISNVWTFSNWSISGTALTVDVPSAFQTVLAFQFGSTRVTLQKIASEPVAWSPWNKVNDGYAVIGVGATATASDQFHLFTVGIDHQVYHAYGDGYNWSGFAPLGGYAISPPSAVSFGQNSIFVFVVSGDQSLYYLNWDGLRWNGWYKLGGQISFGIAAGSAGPGRIDVFAVGKDLAMYHLAWNGTAWQPWEYLGGECASVPGVVSLSPGTINVYVLGNDGVTYQNRFDGSSWVGWASESGDGIYGVAACSSAPNRVDLVTVGASDRALYYKNWDGSRWNGWAKEDGVCASSPVIVSGAQNTGDVFVLGDDHAVYHKSFR